MTAPYRTPDLAAECDALRAEVAAPETEAAYWRRVNALVAARATPERVLGPWLVGRWRTPLAFVRRVPAEGARS
mgnify:CR=1 FL=1